MYHFRNGFVRSDARLCTIFPHAKAAPPIWYIARHPLFIGVDAALLHPPNYETGSLGEFPFLAMGIPILTFNMWAWVNAEIIEFYLFKERKADW